jgi:hypothetical protein
VREATLMPRRKPRRKLPCQSKPSRSANALKPLGYLYVLCVLCVLCVIPYCVLYGQPINSDACTRAHTHAHTRLGCRNGAAMAMTKDLCYMVKLNRILYVQVRLSEEELQLLALN